MQIYDNIGINDAIYGQYVITDSNGNIIISKHNTITLDGRKFILEGMLSNASMKSTDLSDYDNLSFSKIVFIKTNNLTDYDLQYSNIKDNITAEVNITTTDINVNTAYTSTNSAITDLCIKIQKSLTVTSSTQFSSVALILSNKETNSEKVFSRIIIDPVYLNTNETYTLTYYIYF